MRLLGTIAIVFLAGCSQSDQPIPAGTPEEQHRTSVTLDNLVYVDPSSATTQHPLVCGTGRDFPAGRELAFMNSQSSKFVHAVFPESVPQPASLDGKFILHGYFQRIRNMGTYKFKKPSDDYQYFVVISWEGGQ